MRLRSSHHFVKILENRDIKPGMETKMERNEIETALARQLISEHFDFAFSQLNIQYTKNGESDNL